MLEKFLALINHIHEWDIEERDFSYLFGQEFKEKRRLKKMDMPMSESSYLLLAWQRQYSAKWFSLWEGRKDGGRKR